MAKATLPKGYPSSIEIPNHPVKFTAVKAKVLNFVIEEKHANPENPSVMMEAPEGLNLKWPGSSHIDVNPQLRPDIFVYLMTSPSCGRHPDFKGRPHKNVLFDLFDPYRELETQAAIIALTSEATAAVFEAFGKTADEMKKADDAIFQACLDLGVPATSNVAQNVNQIILKASNDPKKVLAVVKKDPRFVPSKKLAKLMEEGKVIQRADDYVVPTATGLLSIGDLESANKTLATPQSTLYKQIKQYIID